MQPQLERLAALADAARDGADRGRLPARHGRQQPVRRGPAQRARRRATAPRDSSSSTRPTRPTITAVRGAARPRSARCSSSPARAAGRSKSASMEKLFWAQMSARRSAIAAGRQFVAITDPGTALAQPGEVARLPRDVHQSARHRRTLLGAVALRPGARRRLIGAPVARPARRRGATWPKAAARRTAEPGLRARRLHRRRRRRRPRQADGRSCRRRWPSLGLWIEQLVAESTGKHGKGALPVVDEPLGTARSSTAATARSSPSRRTRDDVRRRRASHALEAAGHPVLRLSTRLDGLGAEFFRWEFATAVAGAALGINPFDEPNVSEAKDKTKAMLARRTTSRGGTPRRHLGGRRRRCIRRASPAPRRARSCARRSRRSARRTTSRFSRTCRPSTGDRSRRCRDPRRSAARDARREHVRGRPALPALDRAVPQGRTRTRRSRSCSPARRRDARRPIPDAPLLVHAAEAGAGASATTQTLEAHDRRTVRIHFEVAAHAAAALERLFADALR